jgi:O-antigen/teichoic acid export membrane protein
MPVIRKQAVEVIQFNEVGAGFFIQNGVASLVYNAGRFLNVGVQAITLVARFLLIFFLAKYLDPALVGYYGLFVAAVGYSLYFVGLDFYTYATREILKAPNEQRGRLLKGQAMLSGLLYLLFLPAALVLWHHSDWPESLLLWFFPILIFEHLNQEVSRLLVALSEPVTASVLLFIRQGSWALVIVALMAWDPSSRHLQTVMFLWAVAGFAAAVAGVWKVRKLRMGGWREALDWHWIRSGIAVSASFLLATLALRGIQTFDRYWLESLGGIEIVAAYVLYFGVAGTLLTFLDAGLFAFTYPALIQLHLDQKTNVAHAMVRRMLGFTILLSGGFAFISWLLLPYLLLWINNPVYSKAINLYPWLLLAMIVNAFSMVPHYALYARGHDRPIIHSHIAALIVFVLATWTFSAHFSAMAVPIGLNLSFAVILVWKAIAYMQLKKADSTPKLVPQTV